MSTAGRSLGPLALGAATILATLLSAPSIASQNARAPVIRVPSSRVPQPRSTANPYGGLRGNSERGRATIGYSRRGISDRATARSRPLVEADEPATKGALRPTGGAGPAAPAAPAGGAAPARRPKAAAPPSAPLDRFRPRLIKLREGGILRGRARLDDGEWILQTPDGWDRIPEDDVRRADLESDILAIVKKRRRGRDRSDPTVRLDEARLMLDLGLNTEALEELDVLLDLDDVGQDALALLERAELPPMVPTPDAQLAAPEAMAQLLEFGRRSTPAVQELVIAELVPYGARHRNDLEQLLEEQRNADDPKLRAFGERALRRLFPARSR